MVSADAKLTSVVTKVNSIRPTESFAVLVDGTSNTILAHARKDLTLKPLTDLAAGLDGATLARLLQGGDHVELMIEGAPQMVYAPKSMGRPGCC